MAQSGIFALCNIYHFSQFVKCLKCGHVWEEVQKKAINMTRMMGVPVLGLVENYSYLVCSKCGEKVKVFGESSGKEAAEQVQTPYLGSLPLDYKLAELCDSGKIEMYDSDEIKVIGEWVKDLESIKNK